MDNPKKSPLSAISSFRLTLYTLSLSLILLSAITYTLVQKNSDWNEVSHKIEELAFLKQKELIKEQNHVSMQKFYQRSTSDYLRRQLEPLTFLEAEKATLEKLFESPGYCGNKGLEERFHLITANGNKISLEEQLLYTSSHFREVELRLTHPIELTLSDLEELLTKIEGTDLQKPLLQITDFSIQRKKIAPQNEVLEVNFTILKREFLDT